MSLTTYSGLKTAIADWVERGDTASVVSDWITLAEGRMNRDLRVNEMIERSTAPIADGFSTVPTDMLAPRSMRLLDSPYTQLQFVTTEQLAWVKQSEPTGTPGYYAQVGSEFEYGPTPVASVTVVLGYYSKIPALSDSNTSNWLLASHPDAYLRGALVEAYLYYRDQEMAAAQEALFQAALEGVRKGSRTGMAAPLAPSPSQYPI